MDIIDRERRAGADGIIFGCTEIGMLLSPNDFVKDVTVTDQEGVLCDLIAVANDHPYEAIIQTARERGCDLILMASHGRRGLKGLLLGSETHKVLTHSKIPVLVHR